MYICIYVHSIWVGYWSKRVQQLQPPFHELSSNCAVVTGRAPLACHLAIRADPPPLAAGPHEALARADSSRSNRPPGVDALSGPS
mmetsp:Transcript_32785/g.53477  ORF Transcript_32785/g.53477 Transcript_32785/m.53477 type:complete len:85 (-) Transcript_32785:313-567(-)